MPLVEIPHLFAEEFGVDQVRQIAGCMAREPMSLGARKSGA
jgi:hypothetical protein